MASIQTFAQSPRIKLNQITKDSVTGSVLISSPTDSGMVYSRDLFISYGADTFLILGGDTIVLQSDLIAEIADSLLNYVNISGTQTITGAKTFTSTLTQSGGDVNFDSGTFFVDESTNRVGIGTSSPSKNLDIIGSMRATRTNTFPAEFVQETSNTTGLRGSIVGNAISTGDMTDGFGPAITFQIQDNTSNLEPIAYFGGFRDGSDVKGGLAFYTATAQYNYQERLTIKSDGYVGIGTSSPSEKLEVNGKVKIGDLTGTGGNAV